MRNLRKLMYAVITMALLAVTGGCMTAPSPSPAPTKAPTGALAGVISGADTGAPLEGAQVTIAGQVGVFTLTTPPDGSYKVTDLPAGAYLVNVQATGYHVAALRTSVAANVTSSGGVALEPSVAAVVTATPTQTPQPSPTAQPSATPSLTLTPSPVVEATPTRRPSVSTGSTEARAASTHAAPVLLEPLDGSVFVGPRRITFRWSGPCCLAEDEYYVVSIPHAQGVEEAWVKVMAWKAPDYLYLLVPDSRRLTWNVSVRRHTGEYPNGQWKGPIMSPLSETWYFTWRTGGGGSSTSPLSPPDSPLPTPRP